MTSPTDNKESVNSQPGPLRIGVVDDHQLFRAGIISLLKEYKDLNVVLQASNGLELLAQLKAIAGSENAGLPHLLLLDIQMPEMNGIETTLRLQKEYPAIRIIILTMHNDEAFIFDLMNKGASGFLAKDKTVDMVVEAIHAVMNTGIYFNEQILQAIVSGSEGRLKTPEAPPVNNLSEREIEIIRLICDQKTNREMAELLDVSQRTVESNRMAIVAKTGVKNTAGLVLYAIRNNLINTA